MSNDYFNDTLGLVDFTRARAAPLNGLSAQVEASFDLLPAPDVFSRVAQPAVVAGGTANAITVTNEIPVTSYVFGQRVTFKAIAANTGAATVNVDGLGAKTIKRGDGNALTANDIRNGALIELIYDGTDFRVSGTITPIDQDGVDVVIAAATDAADAAETAQAAAEAAQAAAEAAIAPYTAADVLAKLVTVDGTGSGVDADVLRGTTPTAHGLALLSSASATATKTTLSLNNVSNTADADKPVSTATQAALDAKAPIANPSFTGTVTLPGAPSADLHAASKAYVDQQVEGLTNLQAKASVAVVATSNLDLTGEETIDGVLTSSSRVLVAGQSTASQNGIYTTGAGAWTRATDADTWAEIENASVVVTGGTTYSGSRWQAQVSAGGTIGSTAMPWVQIGAATAYTASDGITKDGLNFELSPMATMTIKGNDTGGSAIPQDLTATEVTAMLNTFGVAKGLVPAVTATGAQYLGDGPWDDTLTPTSVAASGNVTGANLSGTNTGDQTITLTGDVSGTGTGTFSVTIANSAVTLAKMANVATGTVFYRKTGGAGAPEVQTLATLKTDLGLTGTNSGDQTTITGNAGSATVLQTARNFSITGGATASAVSFDGSGAVALNVTGLDMSTASAGTLAVSRGGTGVPTSTGTGSVVLSASPTFTGVVGFANGTAAAPSIMFSGDTDTGLFRSSANVIGFAAGGASVATLGADGYLNLAGVNASTGFAAAAGSATFPSYTITGDTNTGIYGVGADNIGIATGGTLRVDVSTTLVTSTLPLVVPAGSAAAPSVRFAGDTDAGIYQYSTDGIAFASGGSIRGYFTNGGLGVTGTVTMTGNGIQIATSQTPASAGATGSAGTICWDSSYIYVCVATNTWKRVAIATW